MTEPNPPGPGGQTPPPQGTPAQPYTKTELLAALRAIEDRLYSSEVEAKIKATLTPDQIQAFVAARLHLTAVIAQVNAALMSDIREDLEKQSGPLRQGIGDLTTSLNRLEGAVEWAKAVNGLIGLLGQVVPLI